MAALSSAAMTCKENNASCLSILASGKRPAIFQTAFRHRDRAKHGVFRTIGMANVVAICFAALINWEDKKNADSTLSFRLSSKESFGRRSYCCTLGDHRRAVGSRSPANAESRPWRGGSSPSRGGRASTLSAPDGVRASEAPRRVAYAEITLIYFGSWNARRRL
jgi:hypothetical protein